MGDMMNKDKIINILGYILGIVTAIVVIVFQKNLQMLFISISICAFFIGIILFIKRQEYGTFVSGLGLSGILTFIIFKTNILDLTDSITLYCSTSLGIGCLLTVIYNIIARVILSKKYSMIVIGHVIDLERNPNSKKDYYRPVLEYTIDKNVYECNYPSYFDKNIPAIGDKFPIYVNTNDNLDVFFKEPLLDTVKVYGISIIFAIVCLVIDVMLFL